MVLEQDIIILGSGVEMNLKCNRCNHSWYSRTPNNPKVCPKCKSPYWNKKRIRKLGEQGKC